MSRSYKKNNWVKDKDKHAQKDANRTVRRTNLEKQPEPSYYKKLYNIWDWRFRGRPKDKHK